MVSEAVTAFSRKNGVAAVEECLEVLRGQRPTLVLFFASADQDGGAIANRLREATGAEVLGCTSSGEYTDGGYGLGGLAVMAFGAGLVRRAAVHFASLSEDGEGVMEATRSLERKLGAELRSLDPRKYVGLVLMDALSSAEGVNEALGHAAPFLSFVGGCAGDDFTGKKTRVYGAGEVLTRGVGLAILEVARPFTVVRAAGFTSMGKRFRVTGAKKRIVYQLEGQPADAVFAEAIGVGRDTVSFPQFMHHPFGVMIDGKPWVRSVVGRTPSGGLVFGCAVHEGTELELLRTGPILEDTRDVLEAGRRAVGGSIGAAVLFDCAYRRMELEAAGLMPAYHELLRGYPLVGIHTFGESYLAHQTHTLIGLLFG